MNLTVLCLAAFTVMAALAAIAFALIVRPARSTGEGQ